ncbi:cellulose binding domain-containing protein [Umezawaea endophytica]|uniref:Cellulose binding domain-containing protein n=1 Tax=Umezawaea endophytica TaxID=1654476 RepID=A0A9X2VKW1_9PSEU|nr:cellulose binding domain-containing protein [Umezawaea endophytica]MCS7477038.1 cellulose binding domain-containing protein [Umezawaea endophytica]
MTRKKSVWAAALSLVLAAAGLAVAGAVADTGASAAVNAAATTAGCGKAPGLASGTQTIQSGGKNRTYILRVPGNYDNTRPYRLIFAFHWWGGTATEVASGGTSGSPWAYYGQQELSDNSAILVAPQGIDNAWPNNGGEDVTFVDAVTGRIDAALCVDTTQRFATGFSYGGGMSYALACGRATVFRAVAVFSGAQLSGCDGGTQPVAYLGIHGISDSVLNISQGRSLRDRFVRNNGCTSQNPREPAAGSQTHITTEYSGCRAGYPVVWAAFDGGHLPGAVDGCNCESGVRTWTKGEVWKFFSQFQGTTPNPTTTTTTIHQGQRCQVEYRTNAWNSGLTSEIVITNTGTHLYTGWELVFTLPSGQTITSGWNASYSPSSGQVTARNASYNAEIAPNASVAIGFQASHTGDTAKPTSFTLNGAVCATA